MIDILENRKLFASGIFSFDTTALNVNDPTQFVSVGRINSDNLDDFVLSSYSGQSIKIAINSGNKEFNISSLPLLHRPDYVQLVKLDQDNFIDIIYASFDANIVGVLRNNNGSFTGAMYNVNGVRSIEVSDFNNDGYSDIITGKSYAKELTVLFGTGAINFSQPITINIPVTPTDITSGDFDLDGDIDLFIADYFRDRVTYFANTGSGSFASGLWLDVGEGPTSIRSTDLDNDNRLDLIVSNFISGGVNIIYNRIPMVIDTIQSNGSATYATTIPIRNQLGIAFVANNNVELFINRNNNYINYKHLRTTGTPRMISIADLDNNGYDDIITSSEYDHNIMIFWGKFINKSGGPTLVNYDDNDLNIIN